MIQERSDAFSVLVRLHVHEEPSVTEQLEAFRHEPIERSSSSRSFSPGASI